MPTSLTNLRIPPYFLTVLLALLNFATLAIVSAARHFNSLLGDCKIFTVVWRPPRSAMAFLIWVFLDISFRIFNEPICIESRRIEIQAWGDAKREIHGINSQLKFEIG